MNISHLLIETISVQRMVQVPNDEMGTDKSYVEVTGLESVKAWITQDQGLLTENAFGGSEDFGYEMTVQFEPEVLEDTGGILIGDVIIWKTKKYKVKKAQTANTPRGANHYVYYIEEMK